MTIEIKTIKRKNVWSIYVFKNQGDSLMEAHHSLPNITSTLRLRNDLCEEYSNRAEVDKVTANAIPE